MIPVHIEADFGDGKERLDALAQANTDFTPLMREISEFLVDRVQENFEQEGRPSWAPLSPTTVKQRGGEAHPILRRSGSLYSSFSPAHDATSATVGTNKEYAPTHQFGAKKGEFGQYSQILKPGAQKDTFKRSPVVNIPWGDIPARDMFTITDDDRAALLELVADYERRTAAGG